MISDFLRMFHNACIISQSITTKKKQQKNSTKYGTNVKYNNYTCNSTEAVINCLLNDPMRISYEIEDLVVIDYRDLGDVSKKIMRLYTVTYVTQYKISKKDKII